MSIVIIFTLNHLEDKRNVNCEIFDHTTTRDPWTGLNKQKGNIFQNIPLYYQTCLKKIDARLCCP